MAQIVWQSKSDDTLEIIEALRAAGVAIEGGATIVDGAPYRVLMLDDGQLARSLAALAQTADKAWAS